MDVFYIFLKGMLDYIDNLQIAQIRSLFHTLSSLICQAREKTIHDLTSPMALLQSSMARMPSLSAFVVHTDSIVTRS
jgi:hypothetical protein